MARLLKFVTEEDEARLLTAAQHRRFADGEVILREGERSRSLFVLRSGEARVERMHESFSIEISRLHDGELFGEMGFVEEFEASASVVADGACEVDEIEAARVHAMADADPVFAVAFYRSIAELLSRRLRATSVEALSEFSWGTGAFARSDESPAQALPDPEREVDEPATRSWGGGSPLRDAADS